MLQPGASDMKVGGVVSTCARNLLALKFICIGGLGVNLCI